MGVAEGPYLPPPLVRLLSDLISEFRARAKDTKHSDEKIFLQKEIKEMEVIVRALTNPNYAPVYNAMNQIYCNLSGTAYKPVSIASLQDVIDLENQILTNLESQAVPPVKRDLPDPSKQHKNHQVLIYLDAITNVITDKIAKSTFHAAVDPRIAQQLSGAHHFAVAGYLDVINKGIAVWKTGNAGNAQLPDPTQNLDDMGWFVQYLNKINTLLP
jgi:hypothetical protein